jgi:hypothetical protein
MCVDDAVDHQAGCWREEVDTDRVVHREDRESRVAARAASRKDDGLSDVD